MSHILFLILFFFGVLILSPSALADCGSPTGQSGDLLFNSASKVVQFCNGYSWTQIGGKPKGGGGCTSPSGAAGDILFNSAYRVMQSCNGQEWSAWGKLNGTGIYSGACTGPIGTTGDLVFNSAYGFLQYCDGKTWQQTGAVPPTLTLNFLANRYILNGTTYSNIASLISASGATFTRSTTGTYFNSAGTMQIAGVNTPRLEYDPVTHASKGILIEGYRTNLSLQSEAIDNASWTKGAVTVTANAAVAPDGNTTADKVIANGGNFAYFLPSGPSWTAGQTVTRSVYVKPVTTTYVLFEQKVANTLTYTAFVLSGTPYVQSLGSGTTASIQNVGNGWYRLIATRTFSSASSGANQFNIIYLNSPGNAAAGEYAYFWGAQFEVSEAVTSYIPTATASVTRDEDSLTIPTGTWFNGAAGTLVAGFNTPYLGFDDWPGPASLDDGTQDNAIHIFIGDPWDKHLYTEIYAATNSTFGQNSTAAYIPGSTARVALSFSQNYTLSAYNGATNGTTASAVTLPTVTKLRVGASRGDLGPIGGWIQQIDYYPYILSAADLQRVSRP